MCRSCGAYTLSGQLKKLKAECLAHTCTCMYVLNGPSVDMLASRKVEWNGKSSFFVTMTPLRVEVQGPFFTTPVNPDYSRKKTHFLLGE